MGIKKKKDDWKGFGSTVYTLYTFFQSHKLEMEKSY